MRILGISGSLRRDSHNTSLLWAAARALPPGAELRLLDGLAAVPPYDEDADTDPGPEAVEHLRAQIEAADAVLIATPEYNYGIPGVLKNAIDWASRPGGRSVLRGRPDPSARPAAVRSTAGARAAAARGVTGCAQCVMTYSMTLMATAYPSGENR